MHMRSLPYTLAALALLALNLTASPDPRRALQQIPVWFEANADGSYSTRSGALSARVSPQGVRLETSKGSLLLQFEGSRGAQKLEGVGLQPGVSSYFVGNDRSQWRTRVPHFGKVSASQVYEGVDMVYYADGKNLEFDFIVAPGADPSQIRLRFAGTVRPSLERSGDLLMKAGELSLRQHAPRIYQEVDGRRVTVAGGYRVSRDGEVRFRLGSYDKSLPLVIDPVLAYAGYLPGDFSEVINATVASPDGGFWIAGGTRSQIDVPADTAPFDPTNGGQSDAFVAKIMPAPDSDGSWQLAYWTYLGGANDDEATAIALAGSKLALTGVTQSINWPLAGNAFQTNIAGGTDAFVVLYDPNAPGDEAMNYSSFYGGTAQDRGQAVAADADGTITVVGYTNSGILPGATVGTALQPSNRGGYDAFIFQVHPFADTAATLNFSTFLGGSSTEMGNAVAVDSSGLIYAAGTTMSSDFPLAGASYQYNQNGYGDAFFAVLDPTQTGFSSLIYATYFGGSRLDVAEAITLDSQNRAWVTGYTMSPNLPVTSGAYSRSNSGGVDVFVSLFNAVESGSNFLVYSTYFGGSGADVAYALALNAANNQVTIAGYTNSQNFPVFNMPGYNQPAIRQTEAFVASIDPAKTGTSALVYSTMFGGLGMDAATGVTLDANGNPFVAGFTTSPDLPVGNNPGRPTLPGYPAAFFFQLAPIR
jgi:hypothetical protein